LKYLTPTVWILSVVSLFTDMASEMLYPVMPIYLQSIGFSILLIGILEGVAEACAGLSKGYFGRLSDASGRRLPFVRVGYALSALSKPLMALYVWPLWVFMVRTIDRLGKGLRTGARDALLSDEATAATKGRVFGFHRAMDTLGAVIGPSLALLWLHYYPSVYRSLFFMALVPGVLAVIFLYFIRESARAPIAVKPSFSVLHFLRYWNTAPSGFRRLLPGLLVFALFNSSDVFLLLQTKQSGITDTGVIGLYIFYNLIYALAAFPMGILADKLGLKKIFLLGLFIFCMVYMGMAVAHTLTGYATLFFLYGIYAAATEGVSKAWVSRLVPATETATALGSYAGLQSLCAMLASSLAGFIWYAWGAATLFAISAAMALLVIFYIAMSVPAPVVGEEK